MIKAYSSPHIPISHSISLRTSLYMEAPWKSCLQYRCTLSTSSPPIPLTQSSLPSAFTSSLKLLLPSSQMSSMLPEPSLYVHVLFLYFKKLLFIEINHTAKYCCYSGILKNIRLLKPSLLRYNSSILTELCNHHHNQSLDIFFTQINPSPISITCPPSPLELGNH